MVIRCFKIKYDIYLQPEGEPKEKNYGMLVSHMSQNDVTIKSTEIKYPHTVVPDSEKIRVTVFGKYLFLQLLVFT